MFWFKEEPRPSPGGPIALIADVPEGTHLFEFQLVGGR